jgi:hypothetical protein
MLWTFVIGMILGLAILIWTVGISELVTRVLRHLGKILRYRYPVPLDPADRAPLKDRLRLAPAAFVAELIVVFHLVQL